jgi:hypothetical protein
MGRGGGGEISVIEILCIIWLLVLGFGSLISFNNPLGLKKRAAQRTQGNQSNLAFNT